ELLGELVGAPFPDAGRVRLHAARQDARLLGDQIVLALEDVLSAACARGPLFIVLDDLHWADPPSVAFVDTALRRPAEPPLTILAPARPDVHDRFPRIWARRGCMEIPLSALPRNAGER